MCLHTLYLFEGLLISQIPKHINVLQGTYGCCILLAFKKKIKNPKNNYDVPLFPLHINYDPDQEHFFHFLFKHACCNQVLVILNEVKKKENSRKLAYEQNFFTWKSIWEATGANF